ncbi:hypothetical protein KJ855_01375 [Patescibacteria group bacterium]|nr:hypothetical protein [Patescibacteria group bacterium]
MKKTIFLIMLLALGGCASPPPTKDTKVEKSDFKTESSEVLVYYGKPGIDFEESYPVHYTDFIYHPDRATMMYNDEAVFSTKDRFVIDYENRRIIYPRAAGVFQLEILDIDTGEITLIEPLQASHAVSYRPAMSGNTLAVNVVDVGIEQVIKYDLNTNTEEAIPAFSPWANCKWPAVDPTEKVHAICQSKDELVYKIVDEDGNTPYQTQTEFSSLMAGAANYYWVEEGKIYQQNRDTAEKQKINLGVDIVVESIYVPTSEQYIAVMGKMPEFWTVGVWVVSNEEFTIVNQEYTPYGTPYIGPRLSD